jgi:hypothetical protein
MIDDIDLPQFTLHAVAEAVGCPRVTLSAWRNRHGMFAESGDDTKTAHKLFSMIDICVARAVLVLTLHGLDPPDAIWFADSHLRAIFGILLSGEPFSSLVAFCKDDIKDDPRLSFFIFQRNDTFGDLIAKTNGIITVVDLAPIIKTVLAALKPGEGND